MTQLIGLSRLSVRKLISKITKRAPRKGSRVAAPSLPYEDWLIEQLKNPAEAAAYLETVLEEWDQAAIMLALRQVDALEIRQSRTKEFDSGAGGNWLTHRSEADRETNCVVTQRSFGLGHFGTVGGKKRSHSVILGYHQKSQRAVFLRIVP